MSRDLNPSTETVEQMKKLRIRLYNISHSFAINVEPYIQRSLHKCPLSFGLMEEMLSPNYLFDSPWTPKINNIHANATSTTTNNVSNPTTTTTTTATSNVSHTGGDTSGNLNSGYGHRGKRKEESNKKSKQKGTKWTQEDYELFNKSLGKRGARDVTGIASDTNQTKER